tara:strand:- start:435 stop:695 length:261 start_codon:yes stop_codon:yes gene_type:complete
MNNIIDIIGLFGSILIGLTFIPQTYKTINSNEVKDISNLFLILNITSASLMVIYGAYYFIIPVIISNGSVLINCLIISIYLINNKN